MILSLQTKNKIFMKIRCLKRCYGEFGKIGEEYLVTGILLGNCSLSYLIDEAGLMIASPSEAFQVTDNRIPPNWFCKIYAETDPQYSYKEAVCGYYELCFDEQHYSQLVEQQNDAMLLYYQRKLETEKSLNEWEALLQADKQQKQQSLKDYSVVIAEGQVAEIWHEDCIIATVEENYTGKTFDVEMHPPTRGPLLLDYTAFEKAMQLARAKLMGHIF